MPGGEAGKDGEAICVGGHLYQVKRGEGVYIQNYFLSLLYQLTSALPCLYMSQSIGWIGT